MRRFALLPLPRHAGCILLAASLCAGTPAFAESTDADQVIRQADGIRYAKNDDFLALLKTLDARAGSLSAPQRDWLEYLHAWQLGYAGHYPQAFAAFRVLLAHAQDITVRARARVSLIYDEVNAAQFQDAYIVMRDLLASLPQVRDADTRILVLVAAAYVYSRGGEFDRAMDYVDQALALDPDERSACAIRENQVWILQEAGKLVPGDARIKVGLDACKQAGDTADLHSILVNNAKALLDHGGSADALVLLLANKAGILASRSTGGIGDFQSTLARSYLATGDLDAAARSAQAVIDFDQEQVAPRSVAEAYAVLYQVAKDRGEDAAALEYRKNYAAADKAYLSGVSARALAYQTVHQHVLDGQRKLQAASDANKMLVLQQQMASQQAQARLLYILLLASGLAMVGLWAWRTKRSQVRFQKLARRDGLTGIFNRQHFIDSAQDVLRYCARNARQACVFVLDLDHFKSVNDRHGHAAGDIALKRVVAACQARLRSVDVFGRLGGEEFAILLPDCSAMVARQRADEMRRDIAAACREGNADLPITASFGVACTQSCGYNLPTLLAAADDAMYAAKRAGRNRVEVQPAMIEATTST
ncbi:MAG: diguanylate cyclase [Proteobacteria bacterium]|nr:diguanylate cyclase [Pseudomonadota bacterium]